MTLYVGVEMRVLLDTNIVIHRENKRISNYSIGHLFRWLDRLKCDKVIHQYTIDEIGKYRDPETQEVLSVKLKAYNIIKTVIQPDSEFLNIIGGVEKDENDYVDNCLLYEVYRNRVDYLITEDKAIKGSPIDIASIGASETIFFKSTFATIGEKSITNTLETIPRSRPKNIHVLKALFTLYKFLFSSSSETIQVQAVDIPEVAKVTAKR